MKTPPTKLVTVPTFDSLPEMVTPEEAGAFLRISRNAMYDVIRKGDVPHVRFGRLYRIPKTALIGPSK